MNPKKSMEELSRAGERIASEFGLEFVSHDFRKQNGTQLQFKVAKDEGLYHQNYCGCMYALKKQREIANVPEVELYSHISKQVQFGSIEERLEFFRVHVAKKSHRFLNYRLLRAFVK